FHKKQQVQSISKNHKEIEQALTSPKKEILHKVFSHILNHQLVQYLPKMKEVSNEQNDAILRANIAALLSNTGPSSLNDLQNYLKDPDPRVVTCAIESLMKLGSSSALANVVEFVSHEDPRLKSTAIKALHNLGDESAFHLFEKMAKSDYSSYRDSVVFALSEITHPRAVFLLDLLLQDSVESIRSKALKALEKLRNQGNKKAKEILSSNVQFKEKIITNYENEDSQDEAPAALHSDDLAVRMNALVEISKSKQAKAIHHIIERLKIEKEIKVISCALIALARVEGPDKLKIRFFMHYLSHKDHRIRANSIECLSNMIPEDRKDFFLAYLNDENNRVIGNSIVALCRSNRYEEEFSYFVIKSILDLYAHQDENFILTGIYCTGVLLAKPLLTSLLKCVRSENQNLKEKSLEILSEWAKSDQEIKSCLDELQNFNKKEETLAKNPTNQKSAPIIHKKQTSQNFQKNDPLKDSKIKTTPKKKSTVQKVTPVNTKNTMILTQAFLILASLFSFYRWANVLLSNEGNLYIRIFSLFGFLLCGTWILIGTLLPLFTKKGKNYLYSLMSIDLFFTLIVGMTIFTQGDVLSGCIFMFHGFGFLATLSAFIFHLQKHKLFL
ncbi:HEAT repeat domain-containing protein, partial [bacterium]|nr:HEAT repeat domain-containing protein [bacterium]